MDNIKYLVLAVLAVVLVYAFVRAGSVAFFRTWREFKRSMSKDENGGRNGER